jgi:glycosyltransferase involved in cell wall biosynthesis
MMNRLAIIIPYYKLIYFEKALESLKKQTCKGFVVYVGDDASPECCQSLIQKYSNDLTIKYVRFDNNLGGHSLVEQWERCLSFTQNEDWIVIFGDDDVLGNNVVEKFYQNIAEIDNLKNKVIRFSSQRINDLGENFGDICKHPKVENGEEFLIRKFSGNIRSSLSEHFFKKDTLIKKKFKKYPLAWFSDIAAILDCSYGNTIYTINEAIVYVRYSDSNISSDNSVLTVSRKLEAQRMFCLDLINNLRAYTQRKQVLEIISKFWMSDKKNFYLFFKLSMSFLLQGFFIEYFSFLIKAIKKIK